MRFIALILALLCSPAFAQVPMTGAGVGAPSGGGVSPTYTAGNCQNNHAAFTTSAQTFSGVQGGSYPSNGLVIVGLVQDQSYTPPQTASWTFTAGGHTLNYISGADDGSSRSTLWYVNVSSGDADTVVLTQATSHTSGYTAICAAFITGMTATPTGSSKLPFGSDNGGVTVNAPFNINASGFGVILYGSTNPTATGTGQAITFANTTAVRDANSLNAGNIQIAMAHQVAPVTSWSPTATGSPNSINFAYSLSAAAWAP